MSDGDGKQVDQSLIWERLEELLAHLYPQQHAEVLSRVKDLVAQWSPPRATKRRRLSEETSFLIAYGDQVTLHGESPLRTLQRFVKSCGQSISAVHVLPFFPYSSDDGFAVVDYLEVREDLGSWEHVSSLGSVKELMIDAVLNHVSSQSDWFAAFLEQRPGFENMALTTSPDADLSAVTRPRTSPLLTRFTTASGDDVWVWTTFSSDQVDVNYGDPTTLLRILQVVLTYAERGAAFLRIDAATYMWKEIGTSCASLPNTHRIVQVLRAVLDLTFPTTTIITETNVPHAENVSYLGEDEAQLVYNFALPPLVMHTVLTQDATRLTTWATGLETPAGTTLFNFLASHDGIGVRGVENILTADEIDSLARQVVDSGGHVSMRTVGGEVRPYELNISYLDALSSPDSEVEERSARFALAHAIALALKGVPAVYLHSLVGSRSAFDLVAATGTPRSINRAGLDWEQLEEELADPSSLRHVVFTALDGLLRARQTTAAFHPLGDQEIIDAGRDFFVVRRTYDRQEALCLHNVTAENREVPTVLRHLTKDAVHIHASGDSETIEPWGYRWLILSDEA